MKNQELRLKELRKFEVTKHVVETNGDKNIAALKLNCTVRNMNRLIIKYKKKGKEGFIHANRGKKPSHTISDKTKETITRLYRQKYSQYDYKQFTKLLGECEGIHLSDSAVRKYCLSEGLLSPKSRKKTKQLIQE